MSNSRKGISLQNMLLKIQRRVRWIKNDSTHLKHQVQQLYTSGYRQIESFDQLYKELEEARTSINQALSFLPAMSDVDSMRHKKLIGRHFDEKGNIRGQSILGANTKIRAQDLERLLGEKTGEKKD